MKSEPQIFVSPWLREAQRKEEQKKLDREMTILETIIVLAIVGLLTDVGSIIYVLVQLVKHVHIIWS